MSRGFRVFHRDNLADLIVAEIEARLRQPMQPADAYQRGYQDGFIAALRFLARAIGVNIGG